MKNFINSNIYECNHEIKAIIKTEKEIGQEDIEFVITKSEDGKYQIEVALVVKNGL